MLVHLVRKSRNGKTGPIPVSTTSGDTCPNACPLKGSGCYAKSGPLGMHWQKVSSGARGTAGIGMAPVDNWVAATPEVLASLGWA